jgi:hypothetical protein
MEESYYFMLVGGISKMRRAGAREPMGSVIVFSSRPSSIIFLNPNKV